MNVSISLPLEGILRSLGSLSADNRRWLGEHLIESADKDERRVGSDEEFMKSFFSIPHDNPMPAKEKERMIRNSHYFSPARGINRLRHD